MTPQVISFWSRCHVHHHITNPRSRCRSTKIHRANRRHGILDANFNRRWAGGEGEGSIARETFVNSLAKFTLLDTVKEMRPKSIDCVRALVDIALEDGNFLAESWGSVLRYISQLARLQASRRYRSCWWWWSLWCCERSFAASPVFVVAPWVQPIIITTLSSRSKAGCHVQHLAAPRHHPCCPLGEYCAALRSIAHTLATWYIFLTLTAPFKGMALDNTWNSVQLRNHPESLCRRFERPPSKSPKHRFCTRRNSDE